MKSTGIIRRIDDLGRIVIPKEIRKNLKIKENETLEIFIENENIILKKFSSLNDMDKILKNYLNVLEDITYNNVLITNTDKVICVGGHKNFKYLDGDIGLDIYKVIRDKEKIKSTGVIEVVKGAKLNGNYYVHPILNNGDVIGTIIIYGNNEINNDAIISTKVISKLIVNYIN